MSKIYRYGCIKVHSGMNEAYFIKGNNVLMFTDSKNEIATLFDDFHCLNGREVNRGLIH